MDRYWGGEEGTSKPLDVVAAFLGWEKKLSLK